MTTARTKTTTLLLFIIFDVFTTTLQLGLTDLGGPTYADDIERRNTIKKQSTPSLVGKTTTNQQQQQ